MPHKNREAYLEYQKAYQKVWRAKNIEKRRAYSRKFYEKNKPLYYEKARKWREANPDRHAANFRNWFYDVQLKKKYGLSVGEFEGILRKQKYCCAICRNPFTDSKNRHIDHCHDTNVVRGILCNKCNLAIGLMQNSATIALEAAHYLNK